MPSIRSTLGEGVRLPDLFGEMMFSGPELDRFVRDAEADGGPIVSTDDNLYLEYATPKGNVLDYGASLRATLDLFEQYRTPDPKGRHLVP
jgi:spermidine synthase